ncbi:Acid_phosphatase surE [Hexamita inflata]|uniref:Acid phosphatase surE n=1 Tax=Hexamita inflata TaxID=28002 RepID=A0AA86UBC5_9EUKA|nr:Acid phosphatase surE [Hexamita inflata]
MKIALTNDDGYDAPGILAMYQILSKFHEVRLIAPLRQKSCASHSRSLNNNIKVSTTASGFIIDSTPSDCVSIGIPLLIKNGFVPNLIVSGINSGANLGGEIHYSGTFAAARQGYLMGYPSIAFSNMEMNKCVQEQIKFKQVVNQIIHLASNEFVLNVNFPVVKMKQKQMEEKEENIQINEKEDRLESKVEEDINENIEHENELKIVICEVDTEVMYRPSKEVINKTTNGFEVEVSGAKETTNHIQGRDIWMCKAGYVTVSRIKGCVNCK